MLRCKKLIKKVYFGKFIAGNSFLHKVDPRIKILSLFSIFYVVFTINHIASLLVIFLGALIITLFSSVSPKNYLKSLKPVILMSVITCAINFICEYNFHFMKENSFYVNPKIAKNSVVVFIRLISVILLSSVNMYTTSPNQISKALESILSPLKIFKINVQEVAVTITISLRFLPILFEEAENIYNAQLVRGAKFHDKNLIVKLKAYLAVIAPLFISALKKANDLAISMESRSYDSSKKRSSFKTLKFSYRDLIASIYILILVLGAYACNKYIII